MPAELAPASGRLVAGRYQLRSIIGRGGAGTVWKAEDVLLRRPVAVKEVHLPATLSDEERRVLRERVLREGRTAAAVRHPVLVTVYDVVEDEDRPWLVMELVEARTLAARVAEQPLTLSEAARIGLDLLAALQAVHRAGIQHRDVKPGNVLLELDGRPRLTDFGIASTTEDPGLTNTGVLLGSPSYLPPERARGGSGGPESDLWGLAATLYTAVEGTPPYDGGHPLAVLTAVVEGRRRPAVRAGALEPLLADLLDCPPEARPRADEVRRRLLEVAGSELAELPTSPGRGLGPRPPEASDGGTNPATEVQPVGGSGDTQLFAARRSPGSRIAGLRDHPRVLASAALAVVVLVAAVLLATAHSRTPPSPAPTRDPRGPAAATVALPTANLDATAATAPTPPGWIRYRDPSGWSVAHPADWKRTTLGSSGVDFVEPGTGSYLHVETVATPPASVIEDWTTREGQLRPRVSNYARVRIVPADGGAGTRAADWEFTFGLAGSPLRAVDRGIATASTGYSLYWQTPADRWTLSQPTVASLFGSFAMR